MHEPTLRREDSWRERGYRFAQRLGPVAVRAPVRDAGRSNPLVSYFDGHTEGRGIWKWRHYLDVYHRHLAKFVGGDDVRLMEVGVFSGGSLDMWRAYLGERSHVYGVDIEPACKVYENEGVNLFIGDQGDPEFWEAVVSAVEAVDIVIDDGSHEFEDQVMTLEALLPWVRPGGIYICEDAHGGDNPFNRYVDGFTRDLDDFALLPATDDGSRSQPLRSVATPLQRKIDSVHRYPWITVIELAEDRPSEFEAPRHGTVWQPFL